MSETALPIKDDGYTSPDFLANLFKKPLYSPISLTSIHSATDESISIFKDNSSAPLIEHNHSALKARNQNCFYGTLSILDDEKIQSKKYRIFFKTLLYGRLSQEEIYEMWNKLQTSISNPFEFDKLIQRTKEKREAEIQTENTINKQLLTKQVVLESSSIQKKSRSVDKKINQQFSKVKYLSMRKEQKSKAKLTVSQKIVPSYKKLIEKEVSSIKAFIFKNEGLIRKKTV